MNTIPLSRQDKWYRTRKPRLQVEILGCLVLRGRLSKKMIESILTHHHHADILLACKNLENRGLIKKNGKKWIVGRGRRQYTYRITERGLRLLITDEPIHPSKFWKAMFGYFHHYSSDGEISSEKVLELYDQFGKNYFKYLGHGFSFQFEIFDRMRDKWFRDFILNDSNKKNNKISIGQKIIEVLAVYPKITFEKLIEEIGEGEPDIRRVLATYTIETYRPLNGGVSGIIYNNMMDKKFDDEYYSDFLFHDLVKISYGRHNQKNYELSVFGVLLALSLIRYNDMGRLNQGLLYENLSFMDYFEKIAANYEYTLPLIFSKWKTLKKILKVFTVYNFDMILDRQIYLSDPYRISVIRGGSMEFYGGIREIISHVHQQLRDLAEAGQAVWFRYLHHMTNDHEGLSAGYHNDYLLYNDIEIRDEVKQAKVQPVYNQLIKVLLMLSPIESLLSISKFSGLQPRDIVEKISIMMEQFFIDEITALYYFNLHYDHGFDTRINRPSKYYDSITDTNKFPESPVPKKCLQSILHSDKEKPVILEWFYKWRKDIDNLYREISETLKLKE